MRLLRLLAAGKSMVGLKQRASRYRPAPAKSLPVFEPVANPFRATATPQAAAASETAVPKEALEPQSECSQEKANPVDVCTPVQGHVAARVSPPEQPPSGTGAEQQEKDARKGGSSGRGKWLKWRPFGKPADAFPPAPVPRAIQGELSLDNVRPVRNDLEDSDFEVVPLKRAARVPKPLHTVQEAMSGEGVSKTASAAQKPQSSSAERVAVGGNGR